MKIELQLFGALRGLAENDTLHLESCGETIEDVRVALLAFAERNWPSASSALLPSCAFASSSSILRGAMPVPDDGRLVVLPPVNGG
jgi:molybdopterin synthase sulfur carrier subunit